MLAKIKKRIETISSSPLIKGAFTLGISGVLCKVIGVFYRVPLTSILGSVGMGIYGLIFPIYSLLLVVSSSAFPVAMSKMIAENLAKKNYEFVKKIIKISFTFLLILGGCLALLVMLLAKPIATLQGASDGFLALLMIAPSIFLVALICVYRGVFQGFGNMTPTGTSQLIEQVVKLILGLLLAYVFLPYGVIYAVAGAMLGITLSELIALLYLKIKYKSFSINLPKHIEKDGLKTLEVFKILIKTVLPITLSGVVIPVFLVIESFLCINLLTFFGQDSTSAISEFGLYSGVVNTLVNVPIVVLTAISISAMPIVSSDFAKANSARASESVTKCINLCTFIGVPCVLLFALFSHQVLHIIYPTLTENELLVASKMLAFSSSTALTLGVFYATTMLLQAMDKFAFPIINVTVSSIIRVILYSVLIKFCGIYALTISSALIYFVMCIVNILYLKKYVILKSLMPFKIFLNNIVFILLCLLLYFVLYPIIKVYSLIFSVLLAGFVYLVLNKKTILN